MDEGTQAGIQQVLQRRGACGEQGSAKAGLLSHRPAQGGGPCRQSHTRSQTHPHLYTLHLHTLASRHTHTSTHCTCTHSLSDTPTPAHNVLAHTQSQTHPHQHTLHLLILVPRHTHTCTQCTAPTLRPRFGSAGWRLPSWARHRQGPSHPHVYLWS